MHPVQTSCIGNVVTHQIEGTGGVIHGAIVGITSGLRGVGKLAGRLDEAASNDKALVGVGMLLFWPALFTLGGTKEQEAEYSRLKGEHDAILETINLKKCASPSQTANGAEAASPAKTAQ